MEIPDAHSFLFEGVQRLDPEGGAIGDPRCSVLIDDDGVEIVDYTQHWALRLTWRDLVDLSIESPVGRRASDRMESPDPGSAVVVRTRVGEEHLLIRTSPEESVQLAALEAWLSTKAEQRRTSAAVPVAPALGDTELPPGLPADFAAVSTAAPAQAVLPPPIVQPASPGAWLPPEEPASPTEKRRRRSLVLVVAGLTLIVLGLVLALVLWHHHSAGQQATRPPVSPEQRMVDQTDVVRSDLPASWITQPGSQPPLSAHDRAIQAKFTAAYGTCMGISSHQANQLVNGSTPGTVTTSSSDLFLGPPVPVNQNGTVQLQSSTALMASRADVARDLALLANPNYPRCTAQLIADEVQLGTDDTLGVNEQPSPPLFTTGPVPGATASDSSALLVSFQVSANGKQIPVVVDQLSLAYGRLEGQLQVVGFDSGLPTSVIASVTSSYEQRLIDAEAGPSVSS